MGNSKSTIDLNGKKYDARTGRIISDNHESSTASSQSVQPSGGVALDGFVKKSRRANPNAPKAVRTPEKSKTLMRPAVHKPVIKNDVTVKQQFREDADSKSRELRAKHAQKSPMIRRFNPSAKQTSLAKKQAPLPVATHSSSLSSKAKSHAQSAKPVATSQANQFDKALQNATSHLATYDGKVAKKGILHRAGLKHKGANIAMISVAGLLLFGFFAYQNAPAIEMRVAATRAGVSADLPAYKPSGYGIGSVKSEPGAVSVAFRSRTDDKGFTLTQKVSNWNSASLLANTVAQSNQPYQTYQDEGKTVYIYNNSNATWVDGGVWYQVEGNASLSSDQLLRIANSL